MTVTKNMPLLLTAYDLVAQEKISPFHAKQAQQLFIFNFL
jgi:hypothetical protein